MNRIAIIISGLALLLVCTVASSKDEEIHQGTIKTIESAKIVLTTSAKEMTFQISSTTQISLDDKPAKASDLKAGDEAMITAASQPAFALKSDAPLASRIDAHRPSNPGNPDPPEE